MYFEPFCRVAAERVKKVNKFIIFLRRRNILTAYKIIDESFTEAAIGGVL